MKVSEIYGLIDRFAPFSSQCEWDHSGLLVGDYDVEVTGVLVCLDVTEHELRLAEEYGANLIVSHHPLIFSPLQTLSFGSLPVKAAAKKICVISAHTNADKAVGGVNDALCELVGFDRFEKAPADCAEGCLNIAQLNDPVSSEAFALLLKKKLNAAVSYVPSPKPIRRVGVCCGGGGEFFKEAADLGCDALLTGEAKYHDFADAKTLGIGLFAAGHFETENGICRVFERLLKESFPALNVTVSDRKNPIRTVI